ncbi:MAG TPA: hypothetical protein ACFYD4_12690 [Candidatus Wunengus sp. YC61]|uniref:hypothetical protein n=1 Tax=Candidatus Wunengus sp. YC61 TaxID=3367698 RepID=UPI004028173A
MFVFKTVGCVLNPKDCPHRFIIGGDKGAECKLARGLGCKDQGDPNVVEATRMAKLEAENNRLRAEIERLQEVEIAFKRWLNGFFMGDKSQ